MRTDDDQKRPSHPLNDTEGGAVVPERARPESGYVELFGLNPLRKLSCGIRDCDKDLHCFHARGERNLEHPRGRCQGCGHDLVHWPSAQVADIEDPAEKRRIMETEMLRHYMWHTSIDDRAVAYARKFGKAHIRKLLRSRIDKMRQPNRPFDGRDVPFKYHPVNYARHATATCCRVCVEYWFGYPKDELLSDEQIERLYRFANYYVEVRFADIPEDVPKSKPIVRKKQQDSKWVP